MSTPTPILPILNQLSATTKRNEKISILESEMGNNDLKRVLFAALDPYSAYNIRKIPEYFSAWDSVSSINTFIDVLPNFSSRVVTGHAAIRHMAELLGSLHPDDAIVAERIIKQDLRCGVQASTVNKVWKDLIPTYPCLLARPYDEKSIQSITWPAYSQLKLDGMRVNIFVNMAEKVVTYRGRSGKNIDIHGQMNEDFIKLGRRYGGISHMVFDGELVVEDTNGNLLPRKKGNGILNKAIKGTMGLEEASRVRSVIWDAIPAESFFEKSFRDPYDERFNTLKEATTNTEDVVFEKLKLVETRLVSNFDEAMAHYREAIGRKEEGTMIKNTNHQWSDTRSKFIIKLKAEEEADLVVIGWNPGTPGTKNEHKVGSLICATSDRLLEVGISGFSDSLRDEITENIQAWIGRIITVKYNEIIDSESTPGIKSLFLPRFQELREDKQVANTLAELK